MKINMKLFFIMLNFIGILVASSSLVELRNGAKVEKEKVEKVFQGLKCLVETKEFNEFWGNRVVTFRGLAILRKLVVALDKPIKGGGYLDSRDFFMWFSDMQTMGLCDERGYMDEDTRNIILSSFKKGRDPKCCYFVGPMKPSWWQALKEHLNHC